MIRQKFGLLVALSLFIPASALGYNAAREIVREFGIKTYYVTRKDQDFYEVALQNVVVKTKYCYEYAMSSEAVITERKIIFLNSDNVCDLEGIYKKQ